MGSSQRYGLLPEQSYGDQNDETGGVWWPDYEVVGDGGDFGILPTGVG